MPWNEYGTHGAFTLALRQAFSMSPRPSRKCLVYISYKSCSSKPLRGRSRVPTDSKDGKRLKVMSLEAVEFIRRFLLHILPPGFVKIRHFGFLANRHRAATLTLCRQHLKAGTPTLPAAMAFTERTAASYATSLPGVSTRHMARRGLALD